MGLEIISNTSSIIYLGKLNIFYLAKNMFPQIMVPNEVIQEIFSKEQNENNIIKKEIEDKFIFIIEVKKIENFNLDKGEKAALSLCLEKNISFLSDDKKARKIAYS